MTTQPAYLHDIERLLDGLTGWNNEVSLIANGTRRCGAVNIRRYQKLVHEIPGRPYGFSGGNCSSYFGDSYD